MPNIMDDFKSFLKILIPEEQLYEINYLINDSNKTYFLCVNIKKKMCMLNELRTLKKEIICKEH